MKRWPIIFVVLTSCTTFSDLEREHPFEGCEPGFVENADGVCVPQGTNNVSDPANNVSNAPNNVSNTPNNVSNMPTCQPEAGRCCPTPDGDFCCTDDGCCSLDPSECQPQPPNNPTNNPNPLLDEFVLVISDADPQRCLDMGGDGPDIFGVRLLIDNAEVFPYLEMFQPGENVQANEDEVMDILQSPDPNQGLDCPQGPSFSLGCGGMVAIGFQSDQPADITSTGHLTVLESGPQCDQAEDLYRLSVCPRNDPNAPDNCYVIVDAFEGSLDQDIQL